MPPKSSSSKKKSISWFFCEQCQIYITFSDFEIHEKSCPDKTDNLEYIHRDIFHVKSIQKRTFAVEELADTSKKFINNLIFLSEGVIKICCLQIGQNVSIRTEENTSLPPLIRTVWPIPEKFLTTVFVSSEDYDLNYGSYKNNPLRIEKISRRNIHPAKQVKYQVLSSSKCFDSNQLRDVESILKAHSKNLVYTKNSSIRLNFFNKPLEFKIVDWSSLLPFGSEDLALEGAIKNLRLDDNVEYFQVLHSTLIEIIKPEVLSTNIESKLNFVGISKLNIGGLSEQIDTIEELMKFALGAKDVPTGIKVSKCCLLFGPTGCGKTLICEAMANINVNVNTIRINSCGLFSKFLGETEKNLQENFDRAFLNYPNPTLMIIDDIHILCPKNESSDISKRVFMSFLSMLDSLHLRLEGSKVFLLATTNNIDNINPAIRRCGRFDNEIEIGAPSPHGREEIIKCLLSQIDHSLSSENIFEISRITHGFVGADLANLISRSTVASAKKNNSQLHLSDIFETLHYVKPSAMREVLIECPNVKWSDIGGQDDLKLKLKQAIEWPLLYPEKFKYLGIKPPRGILMFGPPGCSKTMIAKALATESKVNFLSIKGPELFSMWVGESERAVREIFRKARQVSPAIIFFDEIDAIGSERTSESGSSVKERVLTQLLTELDGVNTLRNVTIVAATNRPDMIDKALLRPGRIDRLIYVGLPDEEARKDIFRIKLRQMPLDENVEIDKLAKLTEGYSGAEIQAVCHEAALKALEIDFNALVIQWSQFEYALKIVNPRTSPNLLKLYDEYNRKN